MTHAGVSCTDLAIPGPYGVYHSMYDDYFWLSRIGDPGLHYNVALARLWGVVLWRLADAAILPMRCSDYTRAVDYTRAIQALIETVERKGPRAPRPINASGKRTG
jgi:N-acetylated-alpha-linked acidic dipeptidase